MLIRPGVPFDAPALAGAWYAMLDEVGLLLPDADPEWREVVEPQIASGMREGGAQWYVAEDAGTIVATAAVFFMEHPAVLALTGRQATIGGVYTKPAYRRRGLARTLVEKLIALCRERDCVSVRLRASAAGRSLYESLGFVTGDEMVLRSLAQRENHVDSQPKRQ